MPRSLPQCPGCVILTLLSVPVSLVPLMACPETPQPSPAPLSRSSTAPSLGPISRGLRGLRKRGGVLRRFTTTVLPGQLRAALASPKPQNAPKTPRNTENAREMPPNSFKDSKIPQNAQKIPQNAPNMPLNTLDEAKMPQNAPEMSQYTLDVPKMSSNVPKMPQSTLNDPQISLDTKKIPKIIPILTKSAPEHTPCPAPPRESPEVAPPAPTHPVPRPRSPQPPKTPPVKDAKPQPAPRTIFMVQFGSSQFGPSHLGPLDPLKLGPVPETPEKEPQDLGNSDHLGSDHLGPDQFGPGNHQHIPWITTPPPANSARSEEVDGGGGDGKKWIRNSSLRRHYQSEHCVDAPHSDTELGKISAPHSLLDGECVSVGGSSMTSERAIDVGQVGSWATSFEKLLEDQAGLHTFAEFLKKEYSHENIYFWTACERYKRLTSSDELRSMARQIFERHLYSGAPEPVNVDSQARQDAQDGLHLPNESLFAQAQKQIFNLMKFDSYSRFLKSSLYQECLALEMRGQPLPYPGDDSLDPDLRIGAEDSHVKLKKSRSDAEERRRKSLLPWNRKDRSKSKDRGEAEYRRRKKSSSHSHSSTHTAHTTHRNTSDSSSLRSDISGSRTSLNSSDLPLGRRAASRESLTSGDQGSLSGGEGGARSARCRVMLPDLTNSVVPIKSGETVQAVMCRLLERRGLTYSTYEVYLHKTDKLLNKKEDSAILTGCEVRLEQRVFFQLDLPSHKTVCIKAKPTKTTGEVLKPILHKYGFKLDLLHIHKDGEEKAVNLKCSVTDIDGIRLVVQTKEEVKEWGVEPGRARRRGGGGGGGSSATLDEITNRVFQDLRNGKTDHHFDDMGVLDLDARSSRTDSSDKSSGILGSFSRRNSFGPDKDLLSKGRKTRGSVHDSLALFSHSEHHSLMAKRRGGGGGGTPMQNKQENDELYEGLKRAQMSRLDDQRGTEINFELPDFLKNDQPQDKASPRALAEQLLARLECSFSEGAGGGAGGEYFSLAHPEVWGGLPSPPLPPRDASANTTLVGDIGGDLGELGELRVGGGVVGGAGVRGGDLDDLGGDLDLDDFEDTLIDDDPRDLPPSPGLPPHPSHPPHPSQAPQPPTTAIDGGAVPPRLPLTALPLSPPPLPPKPKVGGVRGPPPRPPSRQLHLLNPPPPAFPPPPPSTSNSEDEGGLCAPPPPTHHDQLPPLPPLHLGRQSHDKFNISFV